MDLATFWEQIFVQYGQMSGSQIPRIPEVTLLFLLTGPLFVAKKGLLRFFLTAARLIIPLEKVCGVVPDGVGD